MSKNNKNIQSSQKNQKNQNTSKEDKPTKDYLITADSYQAIKSIQTKIFNKTGYTPSVKRIVNEALAQSRLEKIGDEVIKSLGEI